MATTDTVIITYIEPHPRKRDPAEARLIQSDTPVWSLIGHLIGVDWDRERTARDYVFPSRRLKRPSRITTHMRAI